MRRRTPGMVALVVLSGAFAALTASLQSMFGGGSAHAESARGFVRLDAAMRGHPMWVELAAVEKEIDACKADWQRRAEASSAVERDIEACYEAVSAALSRSAAAEGEAWPWGPSWHADIVASALERVRARLEAEAFELEETHEAEARARLDEDLRAERARLDREFDAFREEIAEEYYLPLVSARLKLAVVGLDDDERHAAEGELARLSAEMQSRLDARWAELDSSFAAYSERRRAEVEADIEAFRSEQERATASRLEGERARLESDLAALLPPVEASFGHGIGVGDDARQDEARTAASELSARRERLAQDCRARDAAFAASLRTLESRRESLAARIRADVEAAAHEVEEDLGIVVVIADDVLAAASAPAGVDVTEEVLRVLRQE